MTGQQKACAIIAALTRYTGDSGYKTPRQLYDRISAPALNAMYIMTCRQEARPAAYIEDNMQSIEDRIKLSGYRAKKYWET